MRSMIAVLFTGFVFFCSQWVIAQETSVQTIPTPALNLSSTPNPGANTISSSTATAISPSGVKGDGVTDDTEAIQKALTIAGTKGGEVFLPAGRYLVKGSLSIPPGVTLRGAAYAPSYIEPLIGTVLLAMGGRDNENAPALFEMGNSCCVTGLTVFYPEQKPDDIHPYSWTFHLEGGDNTVENVTLINSYNGIRVGPKNNVRHRIRSVCGCVLRRGILVDFCTDIGRIENVQWHCHWWSAKQVGGDWNRIHEYMWRNCEGFIFGRTDWEYVTNTFIYPVNIGYRFIQTENGSMNGQLCGVGADEAQQCVLVEQIQPMGLLITNGQFVALRGPDPVEVVIQPTCEGSVRFVNCAFWGPSAQVLVSHSRSYVSLNDCYFESGLQASLDRALIHADGGRLQVRGCSFQSGRPSIHLAKGLKHAIVTENNGARGVRIINEIGSDAILANNEPAPPVPTVLSLGSPGDDAFLFGQWNVPEPINPPVTPRPGSTFRSMRFTAGDAGIQWYITPEREHRLQLACVVKPYVPGPNIFVNGQLVATIKETGWQFIDITIPASIIGKDRIARVEIKSRTWVPAKEEAPSPDTRNLGVMVARFSLTPQSSGEKHR